MSEKFSYKYTAPTESERREIEDIKKQYASEEKTEGNLEKLRKLNALVHRTPRVLSVIMGVSGTLVLGLGMTMSLEWNMLGWGAAVGVVGVAVLALAYPIYKIILKRNKNKYGERIIKLSNELLNENK